MLVVLFAEVEVAEEAVILVSPSAVLVVVAADRSAVACAVPVELGDAFAAGADAFVLVVAAGGVVVAVTAIDGVISAVCLWMQSFDVRVVEMQAAWMRGVAPPCILAAVGVVVVLVL